MFGFINFSFRKINEGQCARKVLHILFYARDKTTIIPTVWQCAIKLISEQLPHKQIKKRKEKVLDYNSLKFHSLTWLRHGQRSKYVNTKYNKAWVLINASAPKRSFTFYGCFSILAMPQKQPEFFYISALRGRLRTLFVY